MSTRASTAGPGGDITPFEGPRLRAVAATREHVEQIQACFEGAPDYFARTEGGPPGPDAAERLLADAEGDDLRRVWALVPVAGGLAVGVLDLYLHHPEPGVAHIALLNRHLAALDHKIGIYTELLRATSVGADN